MNSTFHNDDCIFLLKDLTGVIPFTTMLEKERLINSGHNYSEMIYDEVAPSNEVNSIFGDLLKKNASRLALYTANTAVQIFSRSAENTIIVSLARAGSPVGALIKRYIYYRYNVDVPHYSISIIRGCGIDTVALDFIRSQHPTGLMIFVDGWTGKGSITRELDKAIREYNQLRRTNISADLAVLADPAHLSAIAGTRKDVCIPNACLNSTISGLISRTILNRSYIGANDNHGAIRYDKLEKYDVTKTFLDIIESKFTQETVDTTLPIDEGFVSAIVDKLCRDFSLTDINKIKLSIGESSRALIRRVPYIVLVKNLQNPDLAFILYLARKKNIEVREYDTLNYECITLLT